MTNPLKSSNTYHTCLILTYGALIFWAPFTSKDNSWYDFSNLAQGIYIQTISCFMVCLWLLENFILKKFEIIKCKLYLPIGLLIAWSWLSLTWATNISEGLDIAMQWTACAAIFFVLYNSVKSDLDSTIIFSSLMLSLVIIITLGFIQYYNPNFNLYPQAISPAGVFGNKNMLSDYLVIMFPLALYFIIDGFCKKKILSSIISSVVLIASLLLICLSMTRAGILSFPLMISTSLLLLVFLIKKESKFKNVFSKQSVTLYTSVFVLFLVFLVVLMFSGKEGFSINDFGKRIKSILVLPEKDKSALGKTIKEGKIHPVIDSTTIRIITWANTIKMIQDRPIQGVGLNNWQTRYGEYRTAYYNDPSYQFKIQLINVHNEYLQILADLGVVGFLIIMWLAIIVCKSFFQVFFSSHDDLYLKLKALALFISFVGFSIVCFFSILIFKSIPSLVFFVELALLCSLLHQSKANEKNYYAIGLPYKFAAIILVPFFLITCYAANLEHNRGETDKLYKIAENHNFNEDYDAVIQDCKKLLKDAPFKYRAQLMLGAAYIKKGNLDEASVQLEEGLAQYPNELSALFQMGSIYVLRIQKELSKPQPDWQAIKVFEEKGIIWYNRIFNIRYDIEKAWNNLGFIYEKQSLRYKHEGNEVAAALSIRKAEESYSKAVELNSLYVEAIVNKASLFLQTSRNEEATILLLKVLEVTLDGVEKKETELTAIINKGNLENSVAYISINKDRVINRQAFLRVAPKVIGVLKAQLFKLKNYQDYLVVLECELKLKIYQKIDEEEQFNIAKQELEDAKISSDLTQNNARLQLLEKTFNSKKDIFDKATLNLAPNIANLLLQKAEIFSLQNKKEEEVAILKRINVLAETKEIPEQNCEALLKLNAIYMNSSESELRNLLPVIESNFKKASFAGNPALNEFKTGLMKKFMSIKQ